MFDLTGKTALVTGSTQGIGFEIARLLSEKGAKVFINGAKSNEKCIKASRQIPNSVPVRANLLNPEDIEKLYKQTGDVDILVLNASNIKFGKFDLNLAIVLKHGFFSLARYI